MKPLSSFSRRNFLRTLAVTGLVSGSAFAAPASNLQPFNEIHDLVIVGSGFARTFRRLRRPQSRRQRHSAPRQDGSLRRQLLPLRRPYVRTLKSETAETRHQGFR